MADLFADVLGAAPGGAAAASAGAPNVIGLRYCKGGAGSSVGGGRGFGGSSGGGSGDGANGGGAGPVVSILVSKAASRYRIQSDCLPALWLALRELTARLEAHHRAADARASAQQPQPQQPAFTLSLQEDLPLPAVLALIERHFAARAAARAAAAALEARARQFRGAQKRLLARLRDKAPAPLGGLDVLLDETHDQLVALADALEAAQRARGRVARALGGALRLLARLAALKFGLAAADEAALLDALDPSVGGAAGPVGAACGGGDDGGGGEGSGGGGDSGATDDVGWEEQAEAALTHLLRSALARSAKEAAVEVAPLARAPDTQRLRKRLTLVLERLAKGGRLAGGGGGEKSGGNGGSGGGVD